MKVCEVARQNCYTLDMKKTFNKITIDELEDGERQQAEK